MRIIGSIAVVLIHVSQQIWNTANINSMNWVVSNFFLASSKWGVPVFVMISGAGILKYGNFSWNVLYRSIKKMMMLFCSWGIIYFVNSMIIGQSLNQCILSVIYGPLWYLLMAIGLYLMAPFCKQFVDDDKLRKYFITLGFICAIVIPTLQNIISLESQTISKALDILIDDFNIYFCMGFVLYFVGGYSIASDKVDNKSGNIFLFLGVAGFIINPLIGLYFSKKTSTVVSTFYDTFNVCICFEAIAIFYFIYKKRAYFEKTSVKKTISEISKCTLGIYLIHKLVIDCFNGLNIKWTILGDFLSIPVLTIIIWLISLFMVKFMKKIPLIKKIV